MQPVQLKMARAALDMTVDQVAAKAGLSHVDIARFESGEAGESPLEGPLRAVFEEAGIEFLGEDAVRATLSSAPRIVPLDQLNSANDE